MRAFDAAWVDWQVPEQSAFWPLASHPGKHGFERLADRLQEVFADDLGVRFFFKDETIEIVFDNAIVARVKKANEIDLGQNIRTVAIMQFVDAQLEIDDLSGLEKVEIVYVLNRLQTSISRVVAQARDGEMQLWVGTLGKGAPGAEIIPFTLPPPPLPPSSNVNVADEVVRPKAQPKPSETTKRDRHGQYGEPWAAARSAAAKGTPAGGSRRPPRHPSSDFFSIRTRGFDAARSHRSTRSTVLRSALIILLSAGRCVRRPGQRASDVEKETRLRVEGVTSIGIVFLLASISYVMGDANRRLVIGEPVDRLLRKAIEDDLRDEKALDKFRSARSTLGHAWRW